MHLPFSRRWLVFSVVPFLLGLPFGAVAQSFRDIPVQDSLYEPVEDLRSRGIIQGYADGTFRPNAKVTRAEAVKIIVGAKGVEEKDLRRMKKSPYADVPPDAWFMPSVEWARSELGMIDGPPSAPSFSPSRTVRKAEFIKMLLLSYDMDPASYGEILLPLSTDVPDAKDWSYPYLRLALATSMTTAGKSGRISPERDVTRADAALLLHRFLLYREGKRTQALLTSVEGEILQVVDAINDKDIKRAEYASARALVQARGAQTAAPGEPLVTGALRVTEAYRALVRGARAAEEKKNDEAVKLYKDAWFIGQQAVEAAPAMKTFANGIQTSAKKLADAARSR